MERRKAVAGCATGEEAYTLAILLHEVAKATGRHFDYEVFGTDLDAAAIEVARTGVYPDGIAVDVTERRLERYFNRQDSTYHIGPEIRRMCVFATQNVIKDPPFTKLDLICCRILLIYLDADTQRQLLPIFHYSLKPGGLLMLGTSESIGTQNDLFEVLDKKWKIYVRKDVVSEAWQQRMPLWRAPARGEAVHDSTTSADMMAKVPRIASFVERLLLARYAPASLVVNDRGDILHIHGHTGLFLEPTPGQPRMNAFEMAREGLHSVLPACLRQAATQRAEVRQEGVRVRSDGSPVFVDLTVSPIAAPDALRGLFLVTSTMTCTTCSTVPKWRPCSWTRSCVSNAATCAGVARHDSDGDGRCHRAG